MSLPPGLHTLTLRYLDAAGNEISNLTRTEYIQVNASPKDTVLYFSDTKQQIP